MTEKRFHYDWKTGRMKDTQSNSQATSNMRILERLINDACYSYEKRIKELEKEKESWKSSACHDMNLKSMLAFEIGKLSETKDIDAFLDFYYKHFCKIDGDVE